MSRPLRDIPSLQATLAFDPSVLPQQRASEPPNATLLLAPPPPAATVLLSVDEVRAIEATSKSRTLVLPPSASTSPARARSAARATTSSDATRWSRYAILAVLAVAAVSLLLAGGREILIRRSRSWVAPMVLSKTDPRVLEIALALERETARGGELSLRREQVRARLREVDDGLALEATFRASFEAALRSDLSTMRAEVARLTRQIAERDAGTPSRAGRRSESEPAGLELAAKLEAARQRVRMLEAALPGARPASTYGALLLRREYERSRVETDRALAEKTTLAKALAELDVALDNHRSLLATIESSPYRIAIEQDAVLGFVPNENLDLVPAGVPLADCHMGPLVCTPAGTVTSVLPGESRSTHPLTGTPVRGRFVRIHVARAGAEQRSLLFARRP